MNRFYNLWVTATLALFYLGPIPWDGAADARVLLFVGGCLLAYNLGYWLVRAEVSPRLGRLGFASLFNRRGPAYAAALTFVLLTAYHVHSMAGRSFLSLSSYSVDFGTIYSSYLDMLADRVPRTPMQELLLLLKAALFPVALYIFMAHFRTDRVLALLIVLPFIGSSFMRGTDKELFDVAIMALVVSHYSGMTRRHLLFLGLFGLVIAMLFVERKLARFSGQMPTCLPDSLACFDFDGALAKRFGTSVEIGRIIATNYLTQGYEGLSRAFDLRFEFNYGIGHLTPVKRLLCSSASIGCGVSDFQERLKDVGWNTDFRWASVYTALANDLHWLLTPAYFAMIGRLHRVAEIDWRQSRNPEALVSLLMVAIFFTYSSANMQLAISLDWVMATLVFVYAAVFGIRSSRCLTAAAR